MSVMMDDEFAVVFKDGTEGKYVIYYRIRNVDYLDLQIHVKKLIREGKKLINVVHMETGEIVDSEINKILFS